MCMCMCPVMQVWRHLDRWYELHKFDKYVEKGRKVAAVKLIFVVDGGVGVGGEENSRNFLGKFPRNSGIFPEISAESTESGSLKVICPNPFKNSRSVIAS